MKDYVGKATDVRNRINLLLKENGLSQNSVAGGDTPTQKRLNSQLSHGSNISLDTVLRVLDACPDVSADWLLRGVGEMYRATSPAVSASVTGANSVTSENATVISQQTSVLSETFVRDMLAEKDKQIQTLLQLMAK